MRIKKMFLSAALLISSFGILASCNTTPVEPPEPTPQAPSQISKKLVASGLKKTTYLVGEALSFEGLTVKLETITDGVSSGLTDYTTYTTNYEEGYVFKEEDVTQEGFSFDVVISAKEEGIRSTTLNLTVNPLPVEPVEATPFAFLSRLRNNPSYTVKNNIYTAKYTPNANYWYLNEEFATSDQYLSFGFAQNDKEILHYKIANGHYKEIDTYPLSNYGSMYSDKFVDYIYDAFAYSNNGVQRIQDVDLNRYKELKPKDNSNIYTIDIHDDITDDKYATSIVQLITNARVAINDFGLINVLGSRTKINVEMKDADTMVINLSDVDPWVTYPLSTTIKIDSTVTIPEVEGWVAGTPEDDKTIVMRDAVVKTLTDNNFTTYLEGKAHSVFTKDYVYRASSNSAIINIAKDFKYDGKDYKAGLFEAKFEKETNKLLSFEPYSLQVEANYSPFLYQSDFFTTEEVNEMERFFNEDTKELILTRYLKMFDTGYHLSGPQLYRTLFDFSYDNKPNTLDLAEFKATFSDAECTIVSDVSARFRVGDPSNPSSTINLKEFGTSKVEFIDAFIKTL